MIHSFERKTRPCVCHGVNFFSVLLFCRHSVYVGRIWILSLSLQRHWFRVETAHSLCKINKKGTTKWERMIVIQNLSEVIPGPIIAIYRACTKQASKKSNYIDTSVLLLFWQAFWPISTRKKIKAETGDTTCARSAEKDRTCSFTVGRSLPEVLICDRSKGAFDEMGVSKVAKKSSQKG